MEPPRIFSIQMAEENWASLPASPSHFVETAPEHEFLRMVSSIPVFLRRRGST